MRVYAVIETGGKQYRTTVGATIDVERLDAEVGQVVELDQVLMIAEKGRVRVGRPVRNSAIDARLAIDSSIRACASTPSRHRVTEEQEFHGWLTRRVAAAVATTVTVDPRD